MPAPNLKTDEPITPMDRVRWAREVVRLKYGEHKTWGQVAKATGLSVATCKRIAADLQRAGDPDGPDDPMQWIRQHLDTLRVTMEEASNTYAAAPEGSAVRVGALKLFKQTSEDIVTLAVRVGFLPRQLGALSAEREMQQMFRELAELAREHDVPDEFLTAVLAMGERRLTQPRSPALPAA